MTLDSGETGVVSNGRATGQPSFKIRRKRRFRGQPSPRTQPSEQPSNPGSDVRPFSPQHQRPGPKEIAELAVEQATHNSKTGEYGQVKSLQPRGWRLREAVKEWLVYTAVFSSAKVHPNVLRWWVLFPPWRVQRWIEIEANRPELFRDMPIHEKISLRGWVRGLPPAPRVTGTKSSYWLKHRAEKALGFYVSNAELKGAMLEAGYRPVWDDRVNMGSGARGYQEATHERGENRSAGADGPLPNGPGRGAPVQLDPRQRIGGDDV